MQHQHTTQVMQLGPLNGDGKGVQMPQQSLQQSLQQPHMQQHYYPQHMTTSSGDASTVSMSTGTQAAIKLQQQPMTMQNAQQQYNAIQGYNGQGERLKKHILT
jgi:hypothetical protein